MHNSIKYVCMLVLRACTQKKAKQTDRKGCQHTMDADNNGDASTKRVKATTGMPAQRGCRQRQHKRGAGDNRDASTPGMQCHHKRDASTKGTQQQQGRRNNRDADNKRDAITRLPQAATGTPAKKRGGQ